MFLGIDGGGTKTAFILVNQDGDVLASHKSSTCYYMSVGMEKAQQVIEQGIEAICQIAKIKPSDIKFTFAGLPAYGESSKDLTQLNALLSNKIASDRYVCDNDMVNGWAAGLGGIDSINIVAGTGSIAYGEFEEASSRAGGWGEIIGDEGSAYWIAVQGLKNFSRMADGRQAQTELYSLIKSQYKLENDLDLIDLIHNKWLGARTQIADVCKIVGQAAEAGDSVAIKIFKLAAVELAEVIDSLRKNLAYPDNKELFVTYSGGVFNSGELILAPLKAELHKRSKNYKLIAPKYSPVLGSAIYAAKCSGMPLTSHALDNLASQLIVN